MAADRWKRRRSIVVRHARSQVILALFGVATLTSAKTARAEQETSEGTAAAPSAQPLDVVLLKNGGMLRGTIAELVPGEYVVITLLNGEQRRIDMQEVKYAGPTKGAPSAEPERPAQPPRAAPATTSETEDAELHLIATSAGIRFHVRTGEVVGTTTGTTWSGSGGFYSGHIQADAYRELCTAPCTAKLAPGSYTFGLSEEDGTPVKADPPVDVEGPLRLSGTYNSYTGMRIAGIGIIIGSSLAGLAMMLSAPNDCDLTDETCEPLDGTLLYGGGAVILVGGLIGIVMALKKDEAAVEVARAQAAPTRPRGSVARGRVGVPVFSARF